MDILGQIASTANPVASAFEARSAQMQQKRDMDDAKIAQEQQQRDNDMLKVFDFAGSGKTDEAMYLAKAKGLDVPQEIFENSDFAKGLATAGNFYGDDPSGAQKFAMAWMQTRDIPDYGQRVIKASQITGKPIDPEDRKFQREIALEQYKNQEKSSGRRQELFIDATKESLGSFTPTPNAGAQAVESYDQFFGGQQSGLMPYSPQFSGATGTSTIQNMAQQRGVDPVLASAVFGAESSFGNDSRVSSAGAIGPMQVMPGTLTDPGFGVQPARDNSEQELTRVGIDYLGTMLKRYNGDVDAALVAYNAGPDNADKWVRAGRDYSVLPDPQQTQPYVQKVKGYMQNGQLQVAQAVPQQASPNLVQTLPPQQDQRQSLLSRAIQIRPQSNLPQLQAQPIAQDQTIPQGLPQGTVMIGTTNGRPVYQAPNGERFVDDGNS